MGKVAEKVKHQTGTEGAPYMLAPGGVTCVLLEDVVPTSILLPTKIFLGEQCP